MICKKTKPAYTIIETVLSMVFIAGLLIFIGIVSLQVLKTYRKGISIKTVNNSAQLIIDDFKRSINASYNLECFTFTNKDFSYKSDCQDLYDNNVSGAGICTGKYSYIWSYAKTTNQSSQFLINGNKTPHLYKVQDTGGQICQAILNGGLLVDEEVKNIIENNGGKELIETGDRELGIHSFAINNVRKTTSNSDNIEDQSFYNISFVLGTFINDDQAADKGLINNNDARCKTPKELEEAGGVNDDSYCSINKFNFSARTITGRM